MIDVFLIMVAGISFSVGIGLLPIRLLYRIVGGLVVVVLAVSGAKYTYDGIFWPNQVNVVFRYAYEECAYLGAVVKKDEDREIVESEPIKRIFRSEAAYPFRLGIKKGNPGVKMPGAMLQIEFLVDDAMIAKGFKVVPEKGGRYWRVESTNLRFSTQFAALTDQPVVPDEALFVSLPMKGTYKVRAQIDGTGHQSMERKFEIKAVDTCIEPTMVMPAKRVAPQIPIATAPVVNTP